MVIETSWRVQDTNYKYIFKDLFFVFLTYKNNTVGKEKYKVNAKAVNLYWRKQLNVSIHYFYQL